MKAIFLLFLLLGTTGIVRAQNNDPSNATAGKPSATTSLMYKVMEIQLTAKLCALQPSNAKCAGRDPAKELILAYADLVRDKDGSKLMIARAAEGDSPIPNLELIIAVQNQRIIELLELLLAKR